MKYIIIDDRKDGQMFAAEYANKEEAIQAADKEIPDDVSMEDLMYW